MKRMKLMAGLLVVVLAVQVSQAATIALWDFEGIVTSNGNGPAAPAATEDANVTASTMNGSVLRTRYTKATYTDNSWAYVDNQANTGTTPNLADAIAGGNYWYFTLTPDAGASMDLSGISFDLGKQLGNDLMVSVLSSETGWTAADSLYDVTGISTLSNYSTTLSAADFTGLTNAVEFRIYWYNGNDDIFTSAVMDNVEVTGTTAIPEPMTLGLLGAGALGLLRRRRQ